ncbi:MAG: DUF58 domain-containing protein [Trueperella sp.]|nr:DUF58 domain-containing protein [Trueperella sp.]
MFLRRGALIAASFSIVAALFGARILLLFWLVWAAVIALDAALASSPKLITVTRSGQNSTRVGEPVSQELHLHNQSRRTIRGRIRDAWPPSTGVLPDRHSFQLAGGSSVAFPVQCVPTRRGTRRSAAVTVRTYGPLQLAGRQATWDTDWTIQVLPPFLARRYLPAQIQRLRELAGRSLLLVRGAAGTEFDSLREYVAGDDVRNIDWRATARLGETVVRTWRPERDRQIIILLDCGRGGAVRIADAPAFDAFIESGLLLGAVADRAGDRVTTLAVSDTVLARVTGARGAQLMHQTATALAEVEPTLAATDWTTALQTIAALTTHPALVVILTTIGPGTIPSGLLEVVAQLRRRHTVLVASAQAADPAPSADIFAAAAAARTQLTGQGTAREIAAAGARTISANPTELPAVVTDAYLELKARGM